MKKYLIVLLVVVLALIGAGIVYLKLSKPLVTVPIQVACPMEPKVCPGSSTFVNRQGPKCEFAPCPVAQAVDETADWKTYKSEKYGFEVKYPPAWNLSSSGDGEDIHLSNYPIGVRGPKSNDSVVVEIQANHTKPSSIDLFSFAKSRVPSDVMGWSSGTLTETNLYGLSVIKAEHSGGEGPDGPGYYIERSADKFFYVLVYIYGQANEQIVNRIISTIKFTK